MKLLLCLACFLLPLTSLAQLGDASADTTKPEDPRVVTFLKAKNYNYSRTPNGKYRATFNLKNDRSQLVFINNTTQTYGSMEIREVYSIVYSEKTPPLQEQVVAFMKDSARRKLGGWEYEVDEKNGLYTIYFTVKLAANASHTVLDEVLDLVISVADDMELEIITGDKW